MREKYLEFLACPDCRNVFKLKNISKDKDDKIKSGELICTGCESSFPIIKYIPRFVPMENYAKGFGFQWTKHSMTQRDSTTQTNISEKRFFEATQWPRDLQKEVILEVGCGSGRFSEQAISTGAMVLSMDYSSAVDANYAFNGNRNNIFIVQADIYRMPYKDEYFDKIFCFGVLQHTPDVKKSFFSLPKYIKNGGSLAIDVYRKHRGLNLIFKSKTRPETRTRYWVRPLTKRIKTETLYKIVKAYINLMWPVARIINTLPYGNLINWLLLIADYRGIYNLSEKELKSWAVLDTFDMLSPEYDSPQIIETIRNWFTDAGLTDIEVHYGYNGIEGRGIKT